MIRPFYAAALMLGSVVASTTAQAGSHEDCLRRIGLSYGAGYHSAAPMQSGGCNHFHWKTICAWPGGGTIGGHCDCAPACPSSCGPSPCAPPCSGPCGSPCPGPCGAPGGLMRMRSAPGGSGGIGARPPAGIY